MTQASAVFKRHLRRTALGVALFVSGLAVQAQVFATPKNLSNSGTAKFGRLAVDSQGNISVVWESFLTDNYDIFLSRSSNRGATFSTPTNISNTATSSDEPQVVLDSRGSINVVWTESNANVGISDVLFSRSNDGGVTFSSPKNLSSDGISSSPQIAVDSTGNINVLWNDGTTNSDIFFSRSVDGGATFSTPMNLANNGFNPRIALDSGGNINVVWEDSPFTNPAIFFSRSTDGGVTFSSPKKLSNDAVSEEQQIAVDSTDNINVVWTDYTGVNSDIFFSRSNDGGVTFSSPKNVSNHLTLARIAAASRIAVDSSGNINVVWSDNSSGNFHTFFSRSVDGGITFLSPKDLANDVRAGSDQASPPQIAVDSGGGINVVWEDSSVRSVFFSRSVDGGVTFSGPENVANSAGGPLVALSSDGNIDLIWENQSLSPFTSDIFFTAAATSPLSNINDLLTGSSLNTDLWSVEANAPGAGSITFDPSQGMVLTLQPGAAARGIGSTCRVAGDFDVQVDFTLIDWPANNLYGLRLGAVDLGSGPFGEVGIYREGGQEFYTVAFTDTSVHTGTTNSDRAGSLRLIRQGSSLSGYFFSGGVWVQVGGNSGAGTTTTVPTDFNLDISSSNASAGGVTVAFKNFKVNSGTISCPPSSPLPSITAVSPTFAIQGQTISNFTVAGSNFNASSFLTITQPGVTAVGIVASVVSWTPTKIVAEVAIANGVKPASYDVTVTNQDSGLAGTKSGAFTVTLAPQTQMLVSPTALDFGSYPINKPVSTEPQYIGISNPGNAPLAVNVGIPDNPAFSAVGTGSAVVGPHGGVSIPVTFRPTAVGLATGTLLITSNNASNVPVVYVKLSGYGGNPNVGLSFLLPKGDSSGTVNLTPMYVQRKGRVTAYLWLTNTRYAWYQAVPSGSFAPDQIQSSFSLAPGQSLKLPVDQSVFQFSKGQYLRIVVANPYGCWPVTNPACNSISTNVAAGAFFLDLFLRGAFGQTLNPTGLSRAASDALSTVIQVMSGDGCVHDVLVEGQALAAGVSSDRWGSLRDTATTLTKFFGCAAGNAPLRTAMGDFLSQIIGAQATATWNQWVQVDWGGLSGAASLLGFMYDVANNSWLVLNLLYGQVTAPQTGFAEVDWQAH
jgi:Cep192 domain 4